MTCEAARPLIHGYVDGELDLASSLELEHHLTQCAECAAAFREIRVLRDALRTTMISYSAPDGLSAAVRAATTVARRAERRGTAIQRLSALRLPAMLRTPSRWATAIAVAAILLVIVLSGGLRRGGPAGDDLIANEIVASHVRSLMANHLADVISTNQHTVKPWFDGKIDFAPTVVDFGAQGYPLSGGRLDYADGRSVAALVYRRRAHIINLFTWPVNDAIESAPRVEKRQGYNLVYWRRAGMEYWAVSDLDETELMRFAAMVRDAAAPAAPPG